MIHLTTDDRIDRLVEDADGWGVLLTSHVRKGRGVWQAVATHDGEPIGPESDFDHDITHAAAMGETLMIKAIREWATKKVREDQ